MVILARLTALAFAAISALHIYWALGGGRSWIGKAVPEIDGKPLFRPGPFATLLVAAVLAGFAATAWLLGQPSTTAALDPYVRPAGFVIAAILLARAIGEFRYIGFFKRVHEGTFARYDTWLYSPLCLVLGASMLILAFTFSVRSP